MNFGFPFHDACLQFTESLISHQFSYIFRKPYKPIDKNDDYFEIIKNPMDLQTVKKKLINNEYISLKHWENEIRLIFKNAILYNGSAHLLGSVSMYFLKKIDKFIDRIEDSNSKNFEEKTKQIYNNFLDILKEMPIEYINNSDKYIQISPYQEKRENQENPIDEKKLPEFPFQSIELPSYGVFDKDRIRKIKDGLSETLSPSTLGDIVHIIHDTDTDFKFCNPKEIDVASMSRRTLIELENYLNKRKSETGAENDSVVTDAPNEPDNQ